MALKFSCDGCGAHVAPDEIQRRGLAIQKEYCPECATKADEFAVDVDLLHDAVTATWREGLDALKAKYSIELPDVS